MYGSRLDRNQAGGTYGKNPIEPKIAKKKHYTRASKCNRKGPVEENIKHYHVVQVDRGRSPFSSRTTKVLGDQECTKYEIKKICESEKGLSCSRTLTEDEDLLRSVLLEIFNQTQNCKEKWLNLRFFKGFESLFIYSDLLDVSIHELQVGDAQKLAYLYLQEGFVSKALSVLILMIEGVRSVDEDSKIMGVLALRILLAMGEMSNKAHTLVGKLADDYKLIPSVVQEDGLGLAINALQTELSTSIIKP